MRSQGTRAIDGTWTMAVPLEWRPKVGQRLELELSHKKCPVLTPTSASPCDVLDDVNVTVTEYTRQTVSASRPRSQPSTSLGTILYVFLHPSSHAFTNPSTCLPHQTTQVSSLLMPNTSRAPLRYAETYSLKLLIEVPDSNSLLGDHRKCHGQ
jgi:hypothetical protein